VEAYKCAIQDYVSGEQVKMNVLTRRMVREEKELDRCEENVGGEGFVVCGCS